MHSSSATYTSATDVNSPPRGKKPLPVAIQKRLSVFACAYGLAGEDGAQLNRRARARPQRESGDLDSVAG